MSELIEFLAERIAEDEASAIREAGRLDVALVGAFAPAHLIAKCASERQIVGWHRDRGLDFCDECGWSMPCPTLRALAAPYVAHPDFLPEWGP